MPRRNAIDVLHDLANVATARHCALLDLLGSKGILVDGDVDRLEAKTREFLEQLRSGVITHGG